MARQYSLTAALLGAGIVQVERAKTMLTALMQACEGLDPSILIEDLSQVGDPDLALLSLTRIVEEDSRHPCGVGEFISAQGVGRRTLRLLGASEFFGNYLVTHPDVFFILEQDPDPSTFLTQMLQSVGASDIFATQNAAPTETLAPIEAPAPTKTETPAPIETETTASPRSTPCWVADAQADVLELRRTYYRCLAQIAAADLARDGVEGAKAAFAPTAAAISDLVDATLEAVLALARCRHDPAGAVAFTVIAMGKTGARELNYISDVDVIYIAQPAPHANISSEDATRIGTQMAMTLGNLCSRSMQEPALWALDAALRPEGKDGALVRPLDSHLEYYARWAKAWEFQALLKARPAAGDRALGQAYVQALAPKVWQAVEREGFVEETRAMRRRVERTLEPDKAQREIKLGIGGLRDVEFTVQLLQLVHGRVDASLRVTATLDAIRVLVDGGYIARDQGEQMADHYRFLRVLEHRTQLYRMRRTHLFPQGAQLRRVGRSIDVSVFGDDDGAALSRQWREVRSRVRDLHEEIYYRPLLPAMAKLSASEAALVLGEPAAQARLAAIGYRDPKRVLAHIEALTAGVSRRAAIQRQLLPVLLGWFADGVDPDGGLLAFRQLSDALGETHWYLHLLRDSGSAAQHLTRILSSSPLVAQLLPGNPEAVQWLDSEADLRPKTREELETEILASFERQPDLAQRAARLQALRGRELLRSAMDDVLHGIEVARAATALTAVGEAVLAGALDLALDRICPPLGAQKSQLRTAGVCAEYLIVAMGRLGGGETGYATDADVVMLYSPFEDIAAREAAKEAKSVVSEVSRVLGGVSAGAWQVDMDLRPEGKAGVLARDLQTLGEYYERWAATWERQALLRARPIVGRPELRKRYLDIIDPHRYGRHPSDKELVEVRRLKARMEHERGGALPGRQVKLGPGGLSDVEWTVQILQMLHAGEVTGLRVTSTREAMRAAWQAGLLSPEQVRALDGAWLLATRIRAANVLGSGRTSGKKLDLLADGSLLEITAALLGYRSGTHNDLVEDYLRAARQARAVVEQVFYAWDSQS